MVWGIVDGAQYGEYRGVGEGSGFGGWVGGKVLGRGYH